MEKTENIDFSIESVELKEAQMDIANVQAGCWGDDGSDISNLC